MFLVEFKFLIPSYKESLFFFLLKILNDKLKNLILTLFIVRKNVLIFKILQENFDLVRI